MLFPWAAVASPAELPVGAFDGPAVATGSALAGASDDDPETGAAAAEVAFDAPAGTVEADPEIGGVAAEAADVPPRLVR
jgi:hypothetical protein